jgi:hypothetical protein
MNVPEKAAPSTAEEKEGGWGQPHPDSGTGETRPLKNHKYQQEDSL